MPEQPDPLQADTVPDLPRPAAPLTAVERVQRLVDIAGVEPWKIGAAGVALVVVFAVASGLARPTRGGAEVVLPRADTTVPAAAADKSDEELVVHVAGAVNTPGLYRLKADARVSDAIAAAGGAASDADLDRINLAAPAADGSQIYVVRQGEAGPPPSASGGGAAKGETVIDLNRATAEELDELPGIGPSTAQAIVDHRAEHGPFRSVDDLLEVRGIGPAKLEAIRKRVKV